MYKHVKTIVAASVLTAGLLAAPIAIYASDDTDGMMGGNSGTTMGQDSGGMMKMMGQMSEMAQNCNAMMTGMMANHGMRPNEQPQAPSDQHQGH